MNTDAVTALVNLANGLHSSGIALVIAIGIMLAVYGAINVLSTESRLARQVPGHNGTGKVYVAIMLCGMLAAMAQVASAGSHQLGWGDATFNEISYVSESSFGVGAQAANAMLTLISTLGWVFLLMGILRWKRALKDGHTGLSAGEDVSAGTVRFIVGVIAICNPYMLDALQNTLGIAF